MHSVTSVLLVVAVSLVFQQSDALPLVEVKRADRISISFSQQDCKMKNAQTNLGQAIYSCPTTGKDGLNDWTCVRYTDLCNDIPDCPNGEDEMESLCMFHRLYQAETEQLVKELNAVKQSADVLISNESDE